MKNKFLSMVLVFILVISTVTVAFAANVDIEVPEDKFSSKVNGELCNVGDVINFTYSLKFDNPLEDFQGYITYSPEGLKLTSFKITESKGVMCNTAISGYVYYSGLIDGDSYDYTSKKTFYTATFSVIDEGEWTIGNTLRRVDGVGSYVYVKNGDYLKSFGEYSNTSVTYTEKPTEATESTTQPTPNYYTVTATAENGTVTGFPEGEVKEGTEVTLLAKGEEGYTFKGFYVGDDKVSASSTYKFKVAADVNVVAKFEKNATARLSISSNAGINIKIGLDGDIKRQPLSNYINPNVVTGQYITVSPIASSGKVFSRWVDSSTQKIVSYSEEFTFMFSGNISLEAQYEQSDCGIVTFMSGYNQINMAMYYDTPEDVEWPEAYAKVGYTFKYWSIDGKTEATAEDIYNASHPSEDTYANVILKAVYEAEAVYYALTVENGKIISNGRDDAYNGTAYGEFSNVDAIKLSADAAPSGKKFAYWADGNGNILSYSPMYSLYINENKTITAVYVDEAETIEKTPISSLVFSYDENAEKMRVTSVVSVPEGCKLITSGLIATSSVEVGTSDDFTSSTADYVKQSTKAKDLQNFRYDWTKSGVRAGQTWYVRAYAIYEDANGNACIYYGDVDTYSV